MTPPRQQDAKPLKALSAAFKSLTSHSIGQITYRISSLLLIATYATALGPAQIGQLEQLLALSMLLIPIASLQAYESFLPIFRRKPQGAISSAMSILIAGSVLSALFFILLYATGKISWLVATSVTAYVTTSMMWQLLRNMLRASEGYRHLVTSEISQSAASLLIGFLLLPTNLGISGAIIAISAGNALASLIATWPREGHASKFSLRHSSWDTAAEILALSRRLIPNVVLWWGIDFLDRFIIAHYAGNEAVGIYSIGVRLAGILLAICLLMYQSWQVYAINELAKEKISRTFFSQTFTAYSLTSSVLASAFMVSVTPISSILFGQDFIESINYAVVILPSIYIASISYFFGIIYFSERSKVSPWVASTAGLVVSIALNFALVPQFGAVAAAASLFASHGLVLTIRYRESKKNIGSQIGLFNFWIPLAVITAQGVAIYAGASTFIALIGVIAIPAMNYRYLLEFIKALKRQRWIDPE